MVSIRTLARIAAALVVLVTLGVLGTGSASAAELSDYRWERRPLLVFAPTDSDARVTETQHQVNASRCEFAARDMVLGVVVEQGTSTLDGQPVGADQAARLREQFGIDGSDFAVVLIGLDGGVKRRVDAVPDMQAIYTLVDGMPMRANQINMSPRC